ncbi:nitroreductase [Candidatus Phytoplasma luffae]|uniref:Nitroreductase n=1 Tax=Loofah witches'-broom phytoplasma TaxID=35773 RepID=A0A975FJP5_LOWBP|nr:nitroreductase family protein [Candidatus Phytoplasma luffae]QTX03056.1 nitroreductase [Candidatus Phytoplasma luffae]
MRIPTVRLFKKNHKISKEKWNQIFDEIRYTPSSFDLQPWVFFVIEDKKNKNKLKTIIQGNKDQLETSSSMVLICGNLNKTKSAEYIYKQKLLNKEITKEQKNVFLNKIKKYYNTISDTRIQNETFLECGIISLHFVLTIQNLGYNACFIGGCSFDKINDLFDISNDYIPIILLAVGKKDIINVPEKIKKFKINVEDFVFFL